jgi:antitoxin ParD1/3/4
MESASVSGKGLPMQISLSHEQEQFVQEQVASGRYPSPSDVVREALRLLQEQSEARQQRIEELKRQIRVGIEHLDAGRSAVLDETMLEGIKKRGRERLAQTEEQTE